jgi:hypothetical protein
MTWGVRIDWLETKKLVMRSL